MSSKDYFWACGAPLTNAHLRDLSGLPWASLVISGRPLGLTEVMKVIEWCTNVLQQPKRNLWYSIGDFNWTLRPRTVGNQRMDLMCWLMFLVDRTWRFITWFHNSKRITFCSCRFFGSWIPILQPTLHHLCHIPPPPSFLPSFLFVILD